MYIDMNYTYVYLSEYVLYNFFTQKNTATNSCVGVCLYLCVRRNYIYFYTYGNAAR